MSTESHHALFRQHSRTFSAAAAWLAPDTFDEIATVYRFCRTVDDLADDHADPVALSRIAAELRGEAEPGELVGSMLALRSKGVPMDAAVQLVEGCRTDLGLVRLPDERALVRYGYLVAGTVGRLVCPLLGVTDPRAIAFAVDLGIGMQLSNIARDVGEDAARDRVYLPATWLAEAGLSDRDVLLGGQDEAVHGVVGRVLDLAERYYASAELGFAYLPFRARVAVAMAAHRYRAIGRLVRSRGAVAVRDRSVLGPLARLRYLLTAPLVASWSSGGHAHDMALHGPIAGFLDGGAV